MAHPEPLELGTIGRPPAPPRRRPPWDRLLGVLLVGLGATLVTPALLTPPPPEASAPVAVVAAVPTASPSPTQTPLPAAVGAGPRPTDQAGDTLPGPAPTEPPPTSAPPEELTGYRWPMDGGRVTTWFQPVDGGFIVVGDERVHDGIDIATFCGDHILSAHDGVVLYAGRSYEPYLGHDAPTDAFYAQLKKKKLSKKALPIVVVIDDGNGYRSLYAHLSRAEVEIGQRVTAGQLIGLEGATGHATGCHLHYGLIRMDGTYLPIARELIKKWHYPERTRERIDPLRVLNLFADHAPREVPGRPPPAISPGYGPTAPLLEAQRAAIGVSDDEAPDAPAAVPDDAVEAPGDTTGGPDRFLP
jgi:murein DD-endopeptidase MepM/ murein hydrolase activator NlpD